MSTKPDIISLVITVCAVIALLSIVLPGALALSMITISALGAGRGVLALVTIAIFFATGIVLLVNTLWSTGGGRKHRHEKPLKS